MLLQCECLTSILYSKIMSGLMHQLLYSIGHLRHTVGLSVGPGHFLIRASFISNGSLVTSSEHTSLRPSTERSSAQQYKY
mmetsp:Transcript_14612/g.21342  ORF Transcript_14612/g.21342 Transcript_14612/m.21342 type:complete len:80 (+) Transcript_14612:559-798(+)